MDPTDLLHDAISRAGIPRDPPDVSENTPPGVRTVICPYDKLHVVRRSKLLEHLRKCREGHPENDYIFCSFNEEHLVKIDMLPRHAQDCPDNPVNKERLLLEHIARTGGYTDQVPDPPKTPSGGTAEAVDPPNVARVTPWPRVTPRRHM